MGASGQGVGGTVEPGKGLLHVLQPSQVRYRGRTTGFAVITRRYT